MADIQPLAFALGLPYLKGEVKKEDMKANIEAHLANTRDTLILDPRFAQLYQIPPVSRHAPSKKKAVRGMTEALRDGDLIQMDVDLKE